MKFVLKMLKPWLKKAAIKYLLNEERTEWLVDELNKKINIPKMSEQEEKKFFLSAAKSFQEVAITMLERL